MAYLGEASPDIDIRRHQIASWIEDAVRPVEHALRGDDDADEFAIVGFTDSKTGAAKPEFEVREYQLDAWGALWDARQTGADHGLIHLATGLGKTSVGVLDAMKFCEEFRAQHGRDPKIMFTVHQNDILTQAAERFRAFIPNATIGFYNGTRKDLDGDITFASLQSLYANLDQLDPKTFDYIIDDEVHHAKADTYERVIKHFKPQFRLGLTATPNRADERDIRELYGDELYSKGLAEALAEGWLAFPDYHIVFDDAVKQAMQSGFEANSLRALAELFNVQPRNDVIAENIKDEMEKIGLEFGSVKTIVFCQNIEHAEEMAELLSGKAYHSETERKDRKKIFDDFKKGELQVITTRDMFNEGVDIPDARLLVFLRSTSSQTIFEQQLGRGLRKAEGKERVSILDFVANVERIAMIKQLATSIRRGANSNGGSKDPEGEATTVGGPDNFGGINIHTGHGDFDFDKLSVALLDKLKEIQDFLERTDWDQFDDQELIDLALRFSPDSPLSDDTIDALSRDRVFPSRTVIIKRWGTLTNFWLNCGFEVKMQPSDLSEEEIIGLIKSTLGEGVLPTVKLLTEASKNSDLPEYSTLAKRFGSLTAIKQALGFEAKDFSTMSAEDIVTLALSLKEMYGYESINRKFINEMSKNKEFPSRTVIDRVFGGQTAFYAACGESTRTKQAPYDILGNDELISRALELSPDKPLAANVIDKLTKEGLFPNRFYIINRFGSLKLFQEACGFDIEQLSKEKLIEMALELSPDKPLTTLMISELSKADDFASPSSVTKIFGSIKAFQEACGFSTKKPSDLSNDELVELAKSLSHERRPTKAEFIRMAKEGQFISYGLITQRFGSMGEFYEICGWS